MSVWEYVCCVDGYRQAHGQKDKHRPGGDLDEARLREMGVEGF